MADAVSHALGKMQRSLTTFFGRRDRPAAAVTAPASSGKKAMAMKATLGTKKIAEVKKVAIETPTKLSARSPKKKGDLPGSMKILAYKIVGKWELAEAIGW